ncbi:MAG: TOBE domain-containing protein, partial [Mesorhizobium sp.]
KGIAASVQPFADSLSGEVADRASSFADAQGQFYVGVRPEHLMIVRDGVEGAASVNVDFVEPLGQTTNVYVDCGGHKFIVVTDRTEAKIGDVVGVAVTPGKSRLVARN